MSAVQNKNELSDELLERSKRVANARRDLEILSSEIAKSWKRSSSTETRSVDSSSKRNKSCIVNRLLVRGTRARESSNPRFNRSTDEPTRTSVADVSGRYPWTTPTRVRHWTELTETETVRSIGGIIVDLRGEIFVARSSVTKSHVYVTYVTRYALSRVCNIALQVSIEQLFRGDLRRTRIVN